MCLFANGGDRHMCVSGRVAAATNYDGVTDQEPRRSWHELHGATDQELRRSRHERHGATDQEPRTSQRRHGSTDQEPRTSPRRHGSTEINVGCDYRDDDDYDVSAVERVSCDGCFCFVLVIVIIEDAGLCGGRNVVKVIVVHSWSAVKGRSFHKISVRALEKRDPVFAHGERVVGRRR